MNSTTMNTTSTVIVDNQAYWIALVNFLNKTISQYGLGLIWLIGNIGSTFTIIVFSQPAFRNSPCTMYFIASSLSQYFTFNFALLTRMLQYGYSINTINTDIWYCKIRFYLFYIFVAIPRYNIILASIDCYFASSRDALRRQWSSQKIAFRLIIGNIVFWCIMYVQVLIFYENPNNRCQFRSGIYTTFFTVYISIDSGILPLSLMFIFGVLTIRNVHQTKRRITTVPVTNNVQNAQPVRDGRMSKKDTQLYRMLVNQIFIFVTLNISNPCYLVYRSFTIDFVKSPLRSAVETFVSNMTYVLVYLGFALTFGIFAFSSKMFRREFMQFIRTKILHRPSTSVANVGTAARTVREVNTRQ